MALLSWAAVAGSGQQDKQGILRSGQGRGQCGVAVWVGSEALGSEAFGVQHLL